MILSASTLKAIMPQAPADMWAPPLAAAMAEFAITMPLRAAAFLAQLAHESLELRATAESLNYSLDGLLSTFPKRFTPLTAAQYAHNPLAIANYVYAHRNGNGDEESGDGWKFRGRGPIQLTGRGNYRAAGKVLGLDLEAAPEIATAPTIGARIAGWYWDSRKLNDLADAGDFLGITKAINGGMNGLKERTAYYEKAKAVLAG